MFHYLDGKKMLVGDKVLVDGKHEAVVELILIPGTPEFDSFKHIKEPTFFLRRNDIGLVEEVSTDSDLVLIERAQ